MEFPGARDHLNKKRGNLPLLVLSIVVDRKVHTPTSAAARKEGLETLCPCRQRGGGKWGKWLTTMMETVPGCIETWLIWRAEWGYSEI